MCLDRFAFVSQHLEGQTVLVFLSFVSSETKKIAFSSLVACKSIKSLTDAYSEFKVFGIIFTHYHRTHSVLFGKEE